MTRSRSTSSSCWATTCTAARRPADYVRKFEQPYAPLLAAGVKFQASTRQPRSPGAGVLQALQHERPALLHVCAQQRPLLRARQHAHGSEAARMDRRHPAGTRARSGRSATSITRCTRMPPATDRRSTCAFCSSRIFIKYGVNVVFSGHDHVYERARPQKGIYYFVSGAGGQLRRGNMRRSEPDRSVVRPGPELHGSSKSPERRCSSRSISRTGQTVDSGVIRRQGQDQ